MVGKLEKLENIYSDHKWYIEKKMHELEHSHNYLINAQFDKYEENKHYVEFREIAERVKIECVEVTKIHHFKNLAKHILSKKPKIINDMFLDYEFYDVRITNLEYLLIKLARVNNEIATTDDEEVTDEIRIETIKYTMALSEYVDILNEIFGRILVSLKKVEGIL